MDIYCSLLYRHTVTFKTHAYTTEIELQKWVIQIQIASSYWYQNHKHIAHLHVSIYLVFSSMTSHDIRIRQCELQYASKQMLFNHNSHSHIVYRTT